MTLPLKAGLFNLKELSPKKAAVSFSLILLLLQQLDKLGTDSPTVRRDTA